MVSSEVFSKCLPHTASLTPGVGGIPELTWQDVLQSIQGIEKKHEGFVRYVYLDDPKGHYDFFAGLMMEVCARPDVQFWCKGHPNKIESLVLFAIREWKFGPRSKYNDNSRAYAYGVSRHHWTKHYRHTYSVVVGAPTYWEDQVLQRVRKRLKR